MAASAWFELKVNESASPQQQLQSRSGYCWWTLSQSPKRETNRKMLQYTHFQTDRPTDNTYCIHSLSTLISVIPEILMSFCRRIDGSACSYPSSSLDQLSQIILDIRRAPENPQKAIQYKII